MEPAPVPISCPCCSTQLSVPTLDAVTAALNLQPLQARILRAIWNGKGHPVMPGKIFNVMYEDDPDGGPSDVLMYRAFKVGLCRLRKRLEGSGVSIVTAGYRCGYRLVLDAGAARAA